MALVFPNLYGGLRMQINHIPLHYTSAEYKYQQLISVSLEERCPILQNTIQELFQKEHNRL